MHNYHRHRLALAVLWLLLALLASCGQAPATTTPAWSFSPGAQGALMPPFSIGALIYAPFVDASVSPPQARLYALAAADGAARWAVTLDQTLQPGETLMPGFASDAGHLFYQGTLATHALDAATGAEQWAYQGAMVLLGAREGRVVVLDAHDRMIVLDGASGAELARAELGLPPPYSYTIDGNTLYVYNAATLAAIDMLSAKKLWLYHGEAMQPPELVCDNLAVLRNTAGTRALDRASGVELWALPIAIGVDACKDRLVYDQVSDGLHDQVRVYDTADAAAARPQRIITPVELRLELGLPAQPAPDPGGVLTPEGLRVRIEETEQTPAPLWDVLTGMADRKVLESRLTATDEASGKPLWVSAHLRARLSPPLVREGLVVVAATPSGERGHPELLAFATARPQVTGYRLPVTDPKE